MGAVKQSEWQWDGDAKGGNEDACQQHPGDLLEQAAILHIFAPYDNTQAMVLKGL